MTKLAASSPKRDLVRFSSPFIELSFILFVRVIYVPSTYLLVSLLLSIQGLFCLSFIASVLIFQIYVLMPKYANCPSPTGQKKAVKIVLHFKIAVTCFQILIQITNTSNKFH